MNVIDASSDADPLVELAEEFAERFRRGERPSLSEYTDQHPDLADRIRKLFPTLVVMEEFGSVAGPSTDPHSTAGIANVPRHLGDFRILREVGRGGMGVVYEAVQESLGRHVALKVLPAQNWKNPVHLERFRREARAVARLHHTNIVPVFGVGQVDENYFYAMQFIQGQGLDSVLHELKRLRRARTVGGKESPEEPPATNGYQRQTLSASIAQGLASGRFPGVDVAPPHSQTASTPLTGTPSTPPFTSWGGDGKAECRTTNAVTDSGNRSELTGEPDIQYFRGVARIGVQAAEALAYSHQQGILHRDVKPGNLLLDSQGTIWLTDFGLAKAEDSEELTSAGDIVGTVRYMAPERFKGDADPRSDVYALGLTLYEMLTLRPAFDTTDRARLIDRITREDPPLPRTLDPRIPRDLETVILKAVAREPEARYSSAAALGEDLQRYLSDLPIKARRISWAGHTWRWCRRNPAVAGLLSAVAAMLVVSIVALAVSNNRIRSALELETEAKDQLNQSLYYQWIAAASDARDKNRSARAEEFLDRCPPQLRSWEWNYLKRKPFASFQDFVLSENVVIMRVIYSPDGEKIAAADREGRVAVWETKSRKPILRVHAHTGMTRGLEFSPDSRFIATGGEDDHLKIWDLHAGREKPAKILRIGRKAVVLALVYSPNGQQVAMSDQDQTIRIWNVDGTDDEPMTLTAPDRLAIRGLEYSADGQQLISISTEGMVLKWDVSSRMVVSQFNAALPAVHAVAFSQDQRFIALGNEHGTVRVIRTDSWEQACPDLSAHSKAVHGLAFGAGSNRLASSGSDSSIRIWDLHTGQEALNAEFNDNERWNVLAFDPDGEQLAAGGATGSVRIFNGAKVDGPVDGGQKVILTNEQPIAWLTFGPKGNRFASAGWDGKVKIWNAKSGKEMHTLVAGDIPLTSVTFNNDEQFIAAGSLDGTVRIWDVESGQEIHPPLNAKAGPVSSVVFGSEGRVLISAHHNGMIRVWDVTTGQFKRDFKAHLHPLLGLALSPNGEFIVSAGGKDNAAKVWKLVGESLNLVHDLDESRGIIRNPTFSPDGMRIAAATGATRNVWLWDVAPGEIRQRSGKEFHFPGTGQVHMAIFHPDGKRLIVVGDDQLFLLDPQTGQTSNLAAPHAGDIKCAALSPDGKFLITGAGYRGYGEIRIWEFSRWGQ